MPLISDGRTRDLILHIWQGQTEPHNKPSTPLLLTLLTLCWHASEIKTNKKTFFAQSAFFIVETIQLLFKLWLALETKLLPSEWRLVHFTQGYSCSSPHQTTLLTTLCNYFATFLPLFFYNFTTLSLLLYLNSTNTLQLLFRIFTALYLAGLNATLKGHNTQLFIPYFHN